MGTALSWNPQGRPSVLFACPHSILDATSGAALSLRTLLASLAANGFRAVALQACIFDAPHGGEAVLAAAAQSQERRFVHVTADGVEHVLLRTAATQRKLMTCEEQEIFLHAFRAELRRRRPDVVITFGGLLLEMTMAREARQAGIPVVFYLVNGGYRDRNTFRDVSLAMTDSQATARLYQQRLGLACHVVGTFIEPRGVVAKERRAEYFTFVNPGFEKGVSVFMPLARLAQQEVPEAKFLVVQSRGRWGEALKVLGYTAADFPNVKVLGHQHDMRAVYAVTRALLLPSVWHESGARVIPEALLNGIPVLASDGGGSPELVGGGGELFALPPEVARDTSRPAGEEVVRPWVAAIGRLLRDPAHYQRLCERAQIEARAHDLQASAARFVEALAPLVAAPRAEAGLPHD